MLPPEVPADTDPESGAVAAVMPDPPDPGGAREPPGWGATTPPWSAAQPVTNRYGPRGAAPFVRATVTGNVRVTAVGHDYDTHHLVLDFGAVPFPLLEGQSIGIAPPGIDENGRVKLIRRAAMKEKNEEAAAAPATAGVASTAPDCFVARAPRNDGCIVGRRLSMRPRFVR